MKSHKWLQSAPVRKSWELVNGVHRSVRRLFVDDVDYAYHPPVFVNSFPKSGTHLLYQVVQVLPTQEFRAFIASQPTFPFRERSKEKLLVLLDRIVPGELLRGHLYYAPEYEHLLKIKQVVHYFIYRDLRDVAVSEAYYLTYMNRWHRLHPYFKRLPNDAARISLSIVGLPDDVGIYYPNIGKRFMRFWQWLETNNVLAMQFEDLISPHKEDVIRNIFSYYAKRTYRDIDIDCLVKRAINNINPNRPHTFRSGKAGRWKDVFLPIHRQQMDNVAGDILVALGYKWD